ncbi:hypothetical protein CTI12_AA044880 [Artemisia annua]|uniref:rRNA N-glycosylase n=1 Tax=Artemisia annua TaxID=35608 RepID=A0A2U1QCY3_ARTAN|nr:hypothetical protein CTI12_AA044880 [Artemisia annua]
MDTHGVKGYVSAFDRKKYATNILNLGKSLKNYKSFLNRIRLVERTLPNDGEFRRENLCNIVLKCGGRKLIFKMNTHDYHLHGYKNNDNTMWEMRLPRDVARLRGSTPTGVDLNYQQRIYLEINKEALVTAFNNLAQMGPNVEATKMLLNYV